MESRSSNFEKLKRPPPFSRQPPNIGVGQSKASPVGLPEMEVTPGIESGSKQRLSNSGVQRGEHDANKHLSGTPGATTAAVVPSSKAGTGQPERLERLAQQRRRLAEQKARLAAGRSASQMLAASQPNAKISISSQSSGSLPSRQTSGSLNANAASSLELLPAQQSNQHSDTLKAASTEVGMAKGHRQISGNQEGASRSGRPGNSASQAHWAEVHHQSGTEEDTLSKETAQLHGEQGGTLQTPHSNEETSLAGCQGGLEDALMGKCSVNVEHGAILFGTLSSTTDQLLGGANHEASGQPSGRIPWTNLDSKKQESVRASSPDARAGAIPFSRSGSQASIAPSSRDALGGQAEVDHGSSFFDDDCDTGETRLGGAPGFDSQNQGEQQSDPLLQATVSHQPAANGHQSSFKDASSTETGDWSRQTAWGSSSSLSTHYPPSSALQVQTTIPPPSAQFRQSQHFRNPSWDSLECFSSSSAAPHPVAPNGNQHSKSQTAWASKSSLCLPGIHQSAPSSEAAAAAWSQPEQQHLPSNATQPQAYTAAWDDSAGDGMDFFADSPLAATPPTATAKQHKEAVERGNPASSSKAPSEAQLRVGEQPGIPMFGSDTASEQMGPSTSFTADEGPGAWGASQQSQYWEDQPGSLEGAQAGKEWISEQAASNSHDHAYSYEPHSSQSAPLWNGSHSGESRGATQTTGPEPSQWQTHSGVDTGWNGSGHQWSTEYGYGSQTQAWGAASQANAGEVPRTAEQAKRCPSGVPPIPLVAFGFGGRVVTMQPRHAPTLSGGLQERLLALGPLQLIRTEHLAEALNSRETTSPQVTDDTAQVLRTFPGVLTSTTPKEKVLKYIADQEAAAGLAGERGQASTSMQTLWGVLRLLVQNPNGLKSTNDNAGKGKEFSPKFDHQISQLLLPQQSAGGLESDPHSLESSAVQAYSDSGLLRPQTTRASSEEEAASCMQMLLLRGERVQALKVATEARLWGPAILLARLCGEAAFQETAAAMLAAVLQPGTPLQIFFTGSLQCPAAEEVADWRASLAILAANRCPANEAAMARLGDQLWEGPSENVIAAHLCYILGGLTPQAFDLGSRLCLPGSDHRRNPRTFASVKAIHRGLILEWARQKGQAGSPQAVATMIPYRLVLAARLSEYGQVEAASQHCTAITAAIGALGSKLPGGLLVVRSLANELQLRLQIHAQAFRISISHDAGGSLMSKAGKWLDRGLSKLIGASELPEGVPASGPRQQLPNQHRRAASGSQPGSPRVHRRVHSAAEMRPGAQPSNQAAQPVNVTGPVVPAPDAQAQTPGPQPADVMEKAPSLTVRGLMSKVGSFTSLLGPSAALNKKEARLGSENKMFYDGELKMWREHGKPPPPPEAPLAPPPTMLPSALTSQAGEAVAQPAEAQPPGGQTQLGALGSSVHSRYVDTLSSGRQSSGHLPRPPGAAGVAPRPPAFFTPPGAAPRHAASFFTPAPARSQTTSPAQALGWGGRSKSVPSSGTESSAHGSDLAGDQGWR